MHRGSLPETVHSQWQKRVHFPETFQTQFPCFPDRDNEVQGVDSAISRTRRLFYVICSRSEKSLAVVCYTKNPTLLKEKLIEKEWFEQEEIILI